MSEGQETLTKTPDKATVRFARTRQTKQYESMTVDITLDIDLEEGKKVSDQVLDVLHKLSVVASSAHEVILATGEKPSKALVDKTLTAIGYNKA